MGEMNIVNGVSKTNSGALPLGIELAFVTENVLAAYSKAISAGATSISEPCEKPWGKQLLMCAILTVLLLNFVRQCNQANKSLKHQSLRSLDSFCVCAFVKFATQILSQNHNAKLPLSSGVISHVESRNDRKRRNVSANS